MTDDEIERIRARLDVADALDPREGGRVGRTLLAALDEARAEAERLRGDLRAETWRADHGHREIAARAEEARAYAERMMRERDEAERQRDCERVRAREWQAVARDSEAARIRLVEERDRARREAIEAAATLCDREHQRSMPDTTQDPQIAGWVRLGRACAARELADAMRAMLGAPTPDTST